LSKITIKDTINSESKSEKKPKDYVIAQGGKRIYKIISKPIDYINKTIDCDYDYDYCILDIIEGFIDDAKNREQFPYNENITQLCMVFIDKPCDEIIKELDDKNIFCLSSHDLSLPNIRTPKCINIDINVIIALCSDINYLTPDSEYISKLIQHKVFIGLNVNETKTLTNEQYCRYIQKEREFLITEIKKYKRVVLCQSAYDDIIRILNSNGSETEKKRVYEIIDELNIEIIDDKAYTLNIIENNIKNFDKIYNKVERDATSSISFL
jgi:hypothetical protein